MKVHIVDNNCFSSLDPHRVAQHLLANGWTERKRLDEQTLILEGKKGDTVTRLRIPLDRSFVDFDEGMGRVIRDLASSESRSQLEVLDDLSTVTFGDVIRFTTYDQKNRSAITIPISDGIALVEKAKRTATAAALSTDAKRAVFPNYRPPTVAEYLDSVRLGQSETGSYKIKLISPLPLQPDLLPTDVAPFERKVVITLMDSLFALNKVSKQELKKGEYRFEPFSEVVSEGVSANLCEALTDSRPKEHHRPIGISVTWSSVINAPKSSTGSIDFDPSVLFFVEQAGKDFRERNPEKVSLRGMVKTLSKDKKRIPKIVVIGVIDDRFRSVQIDLLDQVSHHIAVEAYENDKEIVLSGTLRREGGIFRLDEPNNLRFVEN
jgi:hypothetical protein